MKYVVLNGCDPVRACLSDGTWIIPVFENKDDAEDFASDLRKTSEEGVFSAAPVSFEIKRRKKRKP